jgi:transcriptional regulator with XRE-family HTH domain
MARGPHSSGDDRGGREFAPPLRGGGFRLPGLKHWRLLRGLSQVELARRADLRPDYLWNVESGRKGCNPSAAQHLAELLNVDLLDLRTKYDDAQEAQAASGPTRSRIAYRHVHQAYLKILLVGGWTLPTPQWTKG